MLGIVVDALLGADKLAGFTKGRARVQVAVELGEGAGRDLHADTMSGLDVVSSPKTASQK